MDALARLNPVKPPKVNRTSAGILFIIEDLSLGSIPFGGRLLIIKLLGSSPMCMKPQKQQKNIIHSDIRNILNPVSILFWTRIVTLPSVDSRVTSVNQPLTPTSSSVLAIIDIPNVTILNHTADTNRNADIPSREGHLTCSGMNNGL